jgi:hypothetical protein
MSRIGHLNLFDASIVRVVEWGIKKGCRWIIWIMVTYDSFFDYGCATVCCCV